MRKYDCIIIDFNGTIIDDVDLCLECLNYLLEFNGQKKVSMDHYKHIFTFPIIDYYKAAGFDFNKNSYEDLAQMFIEYYQSRSLSCKLYPKTIETLKYLKDEGYKVVCLSASEKNNLLFQLKHFKIDQYFDDILGIDNIFAHSKLEIARDYLASSKLFPKRVLLIGDTLHDLEVANDIGANCILVSSGHQDVSILKKYSKTMKYLKNIRFHL